MRKRKIVSIYLAVAMVVSLLTGFTGAATVQAEDGLVMHLKFDGDLTDASGNGNHAECTYGKITYEDGIFGQSAAFNGKSYIEIPDNDSLDIKNFTISLWAYKTKNFKTDQWVPYVHKGPDEDCWAPPYDLYEMADNLPLIYLHDTSDDTELDQFSMDGKSIDIRKWFLLTVTYNGSEVRMYENDTLLKKESVTGCPTSTIGDLYIGMKDGEFFFNGYMDDLRIYNRALSANEVTSLYETGLAANPKFLTQTDALIAHYKFNGNFEDATDYNNDAEVSAGKISFIEGKNGKAAKFGKNSYLEVSDNTNLDFDQGFTMTGWVILYNEDEYNTLVNKNKVSTTEQSEEPAYKIRLQHDGYEFDYTPFENQPGDVGTGYTFDGTNKNKWIHVAVTYDTEEIRWYQNGKLVQKEEVSEYLGCNLAHSTGALTIGSDGEYHFNGAIDELKLYNYTLTAKQIEADYKKVDSIYISEANQKSIKEVKVGKTVTLAPSRKYIDTGKSAKLTSGVSYKSSSTKIFTVDKKGVIKGVKKGTATLYITHGAITKSYKVTVK